MLAPLYVAFLSLEGLGSVYLGKGTVLNLVFKIALSFSLAKLVKMNVRNRKKYPPPSVPTRQELTLAVPKAAKRRALQMRSSSCGAGPPEACGSCLVAGRGEPSEALGAKGTNSVKFWGCLRKVSFLLRNGLWSGRHGDMLGVFLKLKNEVC